MHLTAHHPQNSLDTTRKTDMISCRTVEKFIDLGSPSIDQYYLIQSLPSTVAPVLLLGPPGNRLATESSSSRLAWAKVDRLQTVTSNNPCGWAGRWS